MENNRERAIQIVKQFHQGGYKTERADEEMLLELHRILPDPEFDRFIFWGPKGPKEKRYESFTAEEIVDEALSYLPIRL